MLWARHAMVWASWAVAYGLAFLALLGLVLR